MQLHYFITRYSCDDVIPDSSADKYKQSKYNSIIYVLRGGFDSLVSRHQFPLIAQLI